MTNNSIDIEVIDHKVLQQTSNSYPVHYKNVAADIKPLKSLDINYYCL